MLIFLQFLVKTAIRHFEIARLSDSNNELREEVIFRWLNIIYDIEHLLFYTSPPILDSKLPSGFLNFEVFDFNQILRFKQVRSKYELEQI